MPNQIKNYKPPREIAYLKMLLRECNRKPASPGNGFAKMKIKERLAELEADPDGICSEPEDDGNLAWAENYSGPGLGGWQG